MQDDRAPANLGTFTDLDSAQNFRADADRDVVANCRMTFAALLPGPTQGDALIQGDIVPHDGGLSDDHTHTVVDKEALTDCCAGMDLDAGQEATEVGG